MTDHPRFQRPKGDFERCYHDYHGARLVGLVLRHYEGVADRFAATTRAGTRAVPAAILLLVLVGLLAFAYALTHKEGLVAMPAPEIRPSPASRGLDTAPNADKPSELPGKFVGYQGVYLP